MTEPTDIKTEPAEQTVTEAPSGPLTEDGIPTIVNGVELTKVQLQALREAKARKEAAENAEALPREVNGANRDTDPTRYGDWEKAGRAIDFS